MCLNQYKISEQIMKITGSATEVPESFLGKTMTPFLTSVPFGFLGSTTGEVYQWDLTENKEELPDDTLHTISPSFSFEAHKDCTNGVR